MRASFEASFVTKARAELGAEASEDEVRGLADQLRATHYRVMGLKSRITRKRKAGKADEAEQLEGELAELKLLGLAR